MVVEGIFPKPSLQEFLGASTIFVLWPILENIHLSSSHLKCFVFPATSFGQFELVQHVKNSTESVQSQNFTQRTHKFIPWFSVSFDLPSKVIR